MNDIDEHFRKIASQNDEFRRTFTGGCVETSKGIDALDTYTQSCVYQFIRTSKNFSGDIDPFDERDLGGFVIGVHRIVWKIENQGKDKAEKSPDPSNPELTTRILKIMLAEEYSKEPILPLSGL